MVFTAEHLFFFTIHTSVPLISTILYCICFRLLGACRAYVVLPQYIFKNRVTLGDDETIFVRIRRIFIVLYCTWFYFSHSLPPRVNAPLSDDKSAPYILYARNTRRRFPRSRSHATYSRFCCYYIERTSYQSIRTLSTIVIIIIYSIIRHIRRNVLDHKMHNPTPT